MKRKKVWSGIFCVGLLMSCQGADAQVLEIISIIKTAIKKVIVAADLEVVRLQNQTLALQDAQKELENTMQQTELGDISNWVQQQRDLFAGFYQELWQVKNALSTYSRVKDMIEKQAQIVSRYQQLSAALSQDKHFSADELNYFKTVLSGIISQSVQNLNQLYRVINALVTQMNDSGRLAIINEAGNGIDKNSTDLELFGQQTTLLSLQRAKDANDVNATKLLYGIQ